MTLLALMIATTIALPGLGALTAADIGCGDTSRADIACPDDPDEAQFIVSVTSTDFGVSILLTDDGVILGHSCEGAAHIVEMASDLYAQLPADQRLRDDLLWANPVITREVVAHTWGASMGISNGNPVDIVFGDYTGDSSTVQGRIWGGPFSRVIPC